MFYVLSRIEWQETTEWLLLTNSSLPGTTTCFLFTGSLPSAQTSLFPYKGLERTLSRWKNRDLSPPGQPLHWHNLSAVTVVELWNLLQPCNSQGKTWTASCGKLWPISAPSRAAATHHDTGSCVCVPGAAVRARADKKGLSSQQRGSMLTAT